MGHGYKAVNRVLGELGSTAFDWPERVREIEEGWRHSCVCERERRVGSDQNNTLNSVLCDHAHTWKSHSLPFTFYTVHIMQKCCMHTRNIEYVRSMLSRIIACFGVQLHLCLSLEG